MNDSEAQLVEGTVALLRTVDASTGKKSEWVRFRSLAPSEDWTQLHRVARQLREKSSEVSGTGAKAKDTREGHHDGGKKGEDEVEAEDEDEDDGEDEDEGEDKEEGGDESQDDKEEADEDEDEDKQQDSKRAKSDRKNSDRSEPLHQDVSPRQSLPFRRILETMRKGSYSTKFLLRQQDQQPVVSTTVGDFSSGRRQVVSKIYLPSTALPEAVRDGRHSVDCHRVFFQAGATRLKFLIKKEAGLTERPDLALFKPVTARG